MISKRVKVGIGVAIILALAVLAVVFFPKILRLLGYVASVFMPFILAYLFSLLVNPLADLLEKRFKLKRNLAAILVLLICVGIIGGILVSVIAKIVNEIQSLYQNPAIVENIENAFTEISLKFSDIYVKLPESLQATLDDIGENITSSFTGFFDREYTPIFKSAGNIAKSVPGIFIGIIVFLLSSFFMISDSETVDRATRSLFSEKTQNKVQRMKTEIKRYVGGYVKAQLIIMFVVFVILFIGFNVLGIEYSLLIALGTAFFDALPFFGSGAVLITWAVISILTSDIARAIGLIIMYLCVIFTRQMIEPKIVSQKIGMRPILTLMAMYIGYRLFSIGGMIVGPLLLMLFISLRRAGFFDGAIELGAFVKKAIKHEFVNFKEQFKE